MQEQQHNENQKIEFLTNLFGPEFPGKLLIWTSQDKKSQWYECHQFNDLAAYTEANRNKDVYFGIGTSPEDYGPRRRCPADKIASIPGFWIDLDLAGPGHKKQNLPKDASTLWDILVKCEIPPSIVVHSGGGLQAYWPFTDHWYLYDDNIRQEAATLIARWQLWLQIVATEQGLKDGYPNGYDVDSTHDLARVLRLPGTYNHKTGQPRPVQLLENNDDKYEALIFEAFLDKKGIYKQELKIPSNIIALPVNRPVEVAPLVTNSDTWLLDPKGQPPFEKFDELCAIEPRFRATWERKRRDFRDTSPSSYDLSLATFACEAGWTEQEIINLLIASRRKHGDDLKLRPDYYQRTLARAKDNYALKRDQEQENTDLTSPEPPAEAIEEPISPNEVALEEIASLFGGLRVKRWVKMLTDPIVYRIEFEAGSIVIGSGGSVLTQPTFRNKVYTAIDKLIPKLSNKRWERVCVLLAQIKEEEKPDETETPAGFCRHWLRRYVEMYGFKDSFPDAVLDTVPFKHEGKRYFFLEHFKEFLRLKQLGMQKYSQALRELGCEIEPLSIKLDGKWTTRSVWQIRKEL